MPSVDHCLSKPPEMTTLTNSLEVFDTYKQRDDKDSDEESFHLPLDDDESESKYQEVIKNGNANESEDEILNKFESATASLEPIDSRLEERLLNDEEEDEEKNALKENGTHENTKITSKQKGEKRTNDGDECLKDKCNDILSQRINEDGECINSSTNQDDSLIRESVMEVNGSINADSAVDDCTIVKNDVVNNESNPTVNSEEHRNSDILKVNIDGAPNSVDVTESAPSEEPFSDNKDTLTNTEESSVDNAKSKSNESVLSEINNSKSVDNEPKTNENQFVDKIDKDDCALKDSSFIANGRSGKCENSNDSPKSQNEDSEDLFDISIIRDAEEDNAESAYNEAHPEENDEYEDRNDDKVEEDCNSDDRVNNLEEDDEEDDQLKNDDVDIEETKLDCDGIKEANSDGESDSGSKTDLVQIDKEQKQDTSETLNSLKESVSQCGLDEITGSLVGSDGVQTNFSNQSTSDGVPEKTMDVDNEDPEKRRSLKRAISEEGESGAVKKSKKEETNADINKELEKPKEKLPLRTLLSFSDFMKNRKLNKRLTMQDLEEFCLQKICEVIVHKSDLGDVHHHLKLQEQLIETMRKEIQQLTKQARDLEIVNKKLMNDLKQQNTTQKPLNPLKITRSVGLQVKFTPAYDASIKRRQQNPTVTTQKLQVQAPSSRVARNIPNSVNQGLTRQASSPQKQQQQQQQQQQLPKPNTPLLSQALQNRRTTPSTEVANKVTPQPIRPKVSDPKTGNHSASVIDLTDEDDKKDKNKNVSPKMMQKSMTVPLRTTPMRVNTAQGIRLTTSQGKVSPITSVVTSSTAPQLMYVVQSSPQNLSSPLGPKAVVVNFQSTNGVISSALNGSAVSVIPKQSNTIQLKTVTPSKPISNNKVKTPNKHPAPLPPPPVVRVGVDKPLKPIPPKPHLTIRKTDTGIILQWKMPYELDMYEVIASYQLYAYQETSAMPSTDMWRKVGDVKALALPMACTLTQFADKNKYYFAVRPVDIHKRIGVFSEPEEISL